MRVLLSLQGLDMHLCLVFINTLTFTVLNRVTLCIHVFSMHRSEFPISNIYFTSWCLRWTLCLNLCFCREQQHGAEDVAEIVKYMGNNSHNKHVTCELLVRFSCLFFLQNTALSLALFDTCTISRESSCPVLSPATARG